MSNDSIKIVAVGDIFLGDYTISLGYGVRSTIEKYGLPFISRYINEYLRDGDIIFGNLETVLSDIDIDKSDVISLACRGKPEFIDILKNMGLNFINVANNHILQHGEKAFLETIQILQKNDINIVGLKGQGRHICNPIIKNIKNTNVGFLGYCFCPELYFNKEPLYASGLNKDILKEIKMIKDQVDYLIISCHWGVEFINKPSLNVRILAREMINFGADIILGHHPHVVQGIEKYNNSIILYSLGNFIFDITWAKELRESVIATITFNKSNNVNHEMIPLIINSHYQPIPMKPNNAIDYKRFFLDISEDLKSNPLSLGFEENHYNYYRDVYKIKNKIHYQKIIHLLKNIFKLDYVVYPYLIKKMLMKMRNLLIINLRKR